MVATSRGKKTSNRSTTRSKRDPRRSTRFADEGETPSEKRASLARSQSDGSSCSGDDIPDHERKLLRFHGFEANDAGKECMSCYGVSRITVSFMCEVSGNPPSEVCPNEFLLEPWFMALAPRHSLILGEESSLLQSFFPYA